MPYYSATEWPLKICKVKEAWELPLPDHGRRGKSQGEGITIVHPDTGWTEHPELVEGGRYLIDDYKLSRNFLIDHPDTTNYKYWDEPPDSRIWNEREYRFGDREALDFLDSGLGLFPSHGTSAASLLMSKEGHPNRESKYPEYQVPKEEFVTGIAPNAWVIPCRVTRSVLLGPNYWSKNMWTVDTNAKLAMAIFHAVGLKSKNYDVGVISISLGSLAEKKCLVSALKFARRSGIIVCAAAGQAVNTFGLVQPIFPGNSPHTICAAGCDKEFGKPLEGFYGKAVDITAPGWGLTVAITVSLGGQKKYIIKKMKPEEGGSTYSTILIAGACALWQAYHGRAWLIKKYGRPFLHDVFKYVLQKSSCTPAGWDTANRGAGILDAKKLLEFQLPSPGFAEYLAEQSGWNEQDWGDKNTWGRESL